MSRHRYPYSKQEEKEIINYIINRKAYNRLRGIEFWQEMEKANIGENRTYQSLKEHFRKIIFRRLNRKNYYELREENLNNIKLGYRATAAGRRIIKKTNKNNEEQEEDGSEMSGYRPPYTRQEEVNILKYIIENDAYYRLRGRALWQEMEEAGVGKDRTHHSLKEHFRKAMAPRLNKKYYGVIDDKDLFKIKQGYQASAVGRKKIDEKKGNTEQKKEIDLSKTPPTSDSDTE